MTRFVLVVTAVLSSFGLVIGASCIPPRDANCQGLTTCGACTAPGSGCGWCGGTGCLAGTSEGDNGGSCDMSSWAFSSCSGAAPVVPLMIPYTPDEDAGDSYDAGFDYDAGFGDDDGGGCGSIGDCDTCANANCVFCNDDGSCQDPNDVSCNDSVYTPDQCSD